MTPNERVRQSRAELDEAVDSYIANIGTPSADDVSAASEMITLGVAHRKSLLVAAEMAPTEIAEHYRQTADKIQSNITFLISTVNEYRSRRNLK